MSDGYYNKVTKLLTAGGYKKLRSSGGSHQIWAHPDTKKNVTVSTNMKSRHTAEAIMKRAGINHKLI